MALFSQREKFKLVRNTLQIESIDENLRNSLWNCFLSFYWKPATEREYFSTWMGNLIESLIINYFKKPLDTFCADWSKNFETIRNYFFNCKWYEVYDFIEFVANTFNHEETNNKFISVCNIMLEKELSAWRFVSNKIIRVNSDIEVSQIEEALNKSKPYKNIYSHLQCSLGLLSDRKSPDYRNSIKESISAIEALCKMAAKDKKADLSKALKEIEKENKLKIHPALKEALIKLYGYTSDKDGIRHAIMDEPNIYLEDAMFMLTSCSAFINYLIAKTGRAGLKL